MPFYPLADAKDRASGFPGDQVPMHVVVVRYKGPFDFTYLYRTVQRWFEQRRFRFYEERIKDSGKRLKVDWRATREIDEWYAEEYNIKVEMWELSTQEIVVNGEPRKILNGMAQFTIKGSIQADQTDMFRSADTGFQKLLGKIIKNVRWREMEMKGIDVMEYRTQDIQTVIKECLNMTTKENAPW